jgi:hypothetical protein
MNIERFLMGRRRPVWETLEADAVNNCHPERESRDLGGWVATSLCLVPPAAQVPRLTLGMTEAGSR